MERKCKQCGKTFVLTDSEIKFYNDKNLELPKRCKDCREENKSRTQNNAANESFKNYGSKDDSISQELKNLKKGNSLKLILAGIVAVAVIIGVIFGIGSGGFKGSGNTGSTTAFTATQTLYTFKSDKLLNEHFLKHGSQFDYATKEEYAAGANAVIKNPKALHKNEKEDGDDVFYVEDTDEFVILSTDGYIRTYFKPEKGTDYFNRQSITTVLLNRNDFVI